MQNIYTHKNHTHKPTNKKHTCITCSSAWKKLSTDTSKILLQYKYRICRFLTCMKPLPILHMWTAAQQNQQNDPCIQRRLGSAWASVQSDQSFIHRLHEEIVGCWATHWRLRSDWGDAQPDLSLCWFCCAVAHVINLACAKYMLCDLVHHIKCQWSYMYLSQVDKKEMIRNRYNQIPHPAPNTKWERDTYN